MELQTTQLAGSQNNDFFDFLQFADARLKPRLKQIMQSIEQNPDKSFPHIFQTQSALAVFYRFVNNKRVHYFEIIEAAVAQTLKLLSASKLSTSGTKQEARKVLALHDTSLF